MYDSTGTETTDADIATSYVYMVTLNKLIDGYSTALVNTIATTTSATITVDLPSDVQLSAVPLSGNFKIKCVDSEGFESYSTEINTGYASYPEFAQEFMNKGCDRFSGTATVHKG